MKICFLGTACAEPTAENGYTSFLLETDERLLLIDASGNPVQSVLRAGRDPMSIDAVILTHYHADHIAGYPALLQTLGCLGRTRALQVVCSATTKQRTIALADALDISSESVGFPIRFSDAYSAGSLTLKLTDGMHSIPSSMVAVEEAGLRLFYTSDTAYNEEVGRIARGCRTLIHEATFAHRYRGGEGTRGHSSAYEAGMAAAAAEARTLFLCHYCERRHDGVDSAVAEAQGAFSGEVILPLSFLWYTVE